MTQYKIQVGSWTKLPDGKVQEDTRDIMEMMGKVCGVNLEVHVTNVGNFWRHIGVLNSFKGRYAVVQGEPHVVIHDGSDKDYVIGHEQHLFIPYEELQKMLNTPVEAPKEQEMPKVSSLINTKLDCRKADGTVDKELSQAFQEAVTEGMHNKYGGWSVNSYKESVERFTSAPFLFVSESGMLSLGDFDEEIHFNSNSKTQINFKYSRTLTWEATEIEPTTPEPVDEMVDICGVEYSAKELSEALALIKAARK